MYLDLFLCAVSALVPLPTLLGDRSCLCFFSPLLSKFRSLFRSLLPLDLSCLFSLSHFAFVPPLLSFLDYLPSLSLDFSCFFSSSSSRSRLWFPSPQFSLPCLSTPSCLCPVVFSRLWIRWPHSYPNRPFVGACWRGQVLALPEARKGDPGRQPRYTSPVG